MPHISIEVPIDMIGDIQAALLGSGMGVLDSTELSQHIIESNGFVSFKTDKLGKSGVDPALLVQELQRAGLIVRWIGEDKVDQ